MPVAGDRGARGGSRCGREHTDRKYRTELERAPIQWVVPGAARCLLLPTGREEVLDRLGATEIIALCGWPGAQRPATTGEREPAVTEAPLVPPPPHDVSQHRSEEHTSELQSRGHLVCRLLLEDKMAIVSRVMAWAVADIS